MSIKKINTFDPQKNETTTKTINTVFEYNTTRQDNANHSKRHAKEHGKGKGRGKGRKGGASTDEDLTQEPMVQESLFIFDESLTNQIKKLLRIKEETYVIADITTHVNKFVSALLALTKYDWKEKILKVLYKMQYTPSIRFTRPSEHNSEPYKDLNDSQKQIVDKLIGEDVSFIQGPPGTGKSQTILAIATQYSSAKNQMLITAISNKAVDSVIEKFVKYNSTSHGHHVLFATYGNNLDIPDE